VQGKSGEPADIPTLLGTYRHGIYFVGAKARSLEAALEVAIDYVKVTLSAEERADLLAFLRELTPKGGAPMGIWPDIDSDEGVYPDVRPSVAFADPVDDTHGKTAAEVAAEYVVLEDARPRADGSRSCRRRRSRRGPATASGCCRACRSSPEARSGASSGASSPWRSRPRAAGRGRCA
jgi:hypothetical protein